MPEKIYSSCPYCGVGCRLGYLVENGRVVGIEGDETDPVSLGKPCIKGLKAGESFHQNRVLKPLIRENKSEPFREVTYEEAYSFLIDKIKGFKGGDIGFTGSGQMTNEDNFVLSKFSRLVIGSSNIDCCARLCHAATTVAMRKLFGNPAMPNYIDDLEKADVIFSIGTNPANNYPVAFNRIRNARKNGTKYICIDISQSASGKESDIFATLKFSEVSQFVAGICRLLLDNGDYDKSNENKEGWTEFVESLKKIELEKLISDLGIEKEAYLKIYDLIKNAKNLAVMHGMGVTQHQNGVENVISILSLAQLKNAMIIPMRGKVNIQGAGDMGTCPDWLPFGGSPSQIKEVWGEKTADTPGHHMTEFMYSDATKALFLMGDSPAQSMPDLNSLHKKLADKFVVVLQHHKSLTMEFANVVIPVAYLGEADGTISNAERRLRPIRNLTKNSEIKPAWKVLSELAGLLGHDKDFAYNDAEAIFNEIIKTIPPYAELKWEKIFNTDDNFAEKEKYFEKFIPLELLDVEDEEKKYPFLLTTHRSNFHFCSGDETRSSESLMRAAPKSIVLIDDSDALKYGLVEGDMIKITSRFGEVTVSVKINEDITPNVLIAQFHFENVLINNLFGRNLDPLSGTPNLKSVGVNIEKV
jgi:formate dehydrogenase major subunit